MSRDSRRSRGSSHDDESLTGRFIFGVIAAAIGALGMLFCMAMDFWVLGASWVEADTFVDYVRAAWWLPAGVAAFVFAIALWKGDKALDYAFRVWEDWWW